MLDCGKLHRDWQTHQIRKFVGIDKVRNAETQKPIARNKVIPVQIPNPEGFFSPIVSSGRQKLINQNSFFK